RVKAPGELTRKVIAEHVASIVTVDENAIARAVLTLLEQTRTIGEGAGVVALAALLEGRVDLDENDRVVCVISGGNIDMSLVGRSIDFGLSASGRLLSIAVTLPDRPGNLAKLVRQVAALHINVREVRHRRGELHVPVGLTEITLELETRDHDHQDELFAELDSLGLQARVLNQPD
ncbi:MAG TPA: pyridoxal-phosphate dependent enzyme, partial [Wenzhouxiangellaceae bacterium]|nr:pyridoxal-phosphate dependent enzyme [Wenzhouxiangellaceae bacterium]